MQCVYLVVHAVYTFTYPAKREHTVHLEVKGGGGLHCCHVFKIQSSVGGQGNYQCGNLLHTVWHDIISMTIRWKTSTWSRSIHFLVSSPDPTQGVRVCMVRFSKSLGLHYYLGRIFHPPITLQKTPFVIPALETLGHFSMMTATFW